MSSGSGCNILCNTFLKITMKGFLTRDGQRNTDPQSCSGEFPNSTRCTMDSVMTFGRVLA